MKGELPLGIEPAYDEMEDDMREEYDFSKMNARPNPYAQMLRKQITININIFAIDYFKEMAERTGIPYQTLINLYLTDCAKTKRVLDLTWK